MKDVTAGTKPEVSNEQIIAECARCAHCGEPIKPYVTYADGSIWWMHRDRGLFRCWDDTTKIARLALPGE